MCFGVVALLQQAALVEFLGPDRVVLVDVGLAINNGRDRQNKQIVLATELIGQIAGGINDKTNAHGASSYGKLFQPVASLYCHCFWQAQSYTKRSIFQHPASERMASVQVH